jgi:CRISPR-associated protein Cas2
MSHTEQRNWLIAYDIADPRRLARVHRYLKGHAIPVQYSVFVLHGNQIMLERVLSGIAERIAPHADDVRAYHLPNCCEVTMLGRQSFPEGVTLGAPGLDRLLRELTVSDNRTMVEGTGEVFQS